MKTSTMRTPGTVPLGALALALAVTRARLRRPRCALNRGTQAIRARAMTCAPIRGTIRTTSRTAIVVTHNAATTAITAIEVTTATTTIAVTTGIVLANMCMARHRSCTHLRYRQASVSFCRFSFDSARLSH